MTSYSFDLNFPPPSSPVVPSFSSSSLSTPLSLPPSFLHLGVLDDDDRRIQEREQAESEKDPKEGRHTEEGEEKKKKQGTKSLSGEIRGFTFYDAVGPIGTSYRTKEEEEHGGEKIHPKREGKGGGRGERHDKEEDMDGHDGKTKGEEEKDSEKKREERMEKNGEDRIPRSSKSEKVYWSERIQTGGVWGDGVVHFSSYDWSICGQNLMGASHMYDWLVTLDLR